MFNVENEKQKSIIDKCDHDKSSCVTIEQENMRRCILVWRICASQFIIFIFRLVYFLIPKECLFLIIIEERNELHAGEISQSFNILLTICARQTFLRTFTKRRDD